MTERVLCTSEHLLNRICSDSPPKEGNREDRRSQKQTWGRSVRAVCQTGRDREDLAAHTGTLVSSQPALPLTMVFGQGIMRHFQIAICGGTGGGKGLCFSCDKE